MSGTSKIKNENPDDFATYLAKRKAAEEGREWVPAGAAPPAPVAAAPAPAAAAPADSGTSKIKNENPDDFATYMAKRQAAAEGRVWTPDGAGAAAAPAAAAAAPAGNRWVPPDSYATKTLSRDAAFPGSQQAGLQAPAPGGTHTADGQWKHYGYGGYTPRK